MYPTSLKGYWCVDLISSLPKLSPTDRLSGTSTGGVKRRRFLPHYRHWSGPSVFLLEFYRWVRFSVLCHSLCPSLSRYTSRSSTPTLEVTSTGTMSGVKGDTRSGQQNFLDSISSTGVYMSTQGWTSVLLPMVPRKENKTQHKDR